MQYEEIVARFRNTRPCSNGVLVSCPGANHQNGDADPSLKIDRGIDRILMNCKVGCETTDVVEAMGLSMAHLFDVPRNGTGLAARNGNGAMRKKRIYDPRGIALEDFAKAKELPVDFLRECGVSEETGPYGKAQLRFQYLLADGGLAPRQRIRLSLGCKGVNGEPYKRFVCSEGDGALVPYGLWLLPQPDKRKGDLYLVGGESDALTLWRYRRVALGMPGAASATALQAEHVAGFERIIVVREDDKAVQKVVVPFDWVSLNFFFSSWASCSVPFTFVCHGPA